MSPSEEPVGPPVPATIRDVAAAAGVSKTTASDALRGDHRVAAATRQRVEAAARRLHYRHSPALSRIGRQQLKRSPDFCEILVLVMSESDRVQDRLSTATHPQFRAEDAEELSLKLTFEWCRDARDLQLCLRSAYQRGVEGILIERWQLPDRDTFEPPPLLQQFSLVTTADLLETRLRIDSVGSSHGQAMHLLWSKVREAGCQRIGCIVPEHAPTTPYDRERLAAAMLENANQPSRERLPLCRPTFASEGVAEQVAAWVKKHQPEAIIGYSAGDYWHHARELPFAAQVVAKRDLPLISGIRREAWRVGRTALKLLRDKIILRQRGFSEEPLQLLITRRWHPGQTLAGDARVGS